jgi:hypothetical protein
MNSSFTRTPNTEWTATLRLGLWASLVAALAAVVLAGVMPEPLLIIGVIVGASWLSWHQIGSMSQPVVQRARITRR